MGPVHYSRDAQVLYSGKKKKTGFHSTIHTFKNYFATMFSLDMAMSNLFFS